jgi:hypothetical protein
MAIAPQSAMPSEVIATRLASRPVAFTLVHRPNLFGTAAKIMVLMTIVAFAAGFAGAIVLALVAGGITHATQ